MQNPLRSEGAAFRFLLVTVAYFLLIVVASVIDAWAGLAVFIVLTAAVLWRVLHSRRDPDRPA